MPQKQFMFVIHTTPCITILICIFVREENSLMKYVLQRNHSNNHCNTIETKIQIIWSTLLTLKKKTTLRHHNWKCIPSCDILQQRWPYRLWTIFMFSKFFIHLLIGDRCQIVLFDFYVQFSSINELILSLWLSNRVSVFVYFYLLFS